MTRHHRSDGGLWPGVTHVRFAGRAPGGLAPDEVLLVRCATDDLEVWREEPLEDGPCPSAHRCVLVRVQRSGRKGIPLRTLPLALLGSAAVLMGGPSLLLEPVWPVQSFLRWAGLVLLGGSWLRLAWHHAKHRTRYVDERLGSAPRRWREAGLVLLVLHVALLLAGWLSVKA